MNYEQIRRLPYNGAAEQILWKVSPPVKYYYFNEEADTYLNDRETEYVITSATVAMFSGPETYIFPCDENGDILAWGELPGSYRGGLNHEEAIRNLGSEE